MDCPNDNQQEFNQSPILQEYLTFCEKINNEIKNIKPRCPEKQIEHLNNVMKGWFETLKNYEESDEFKNKSFHEDYFEKSLIDV